MILKTEPGGWGEENAIPASALTSPLVASRTAMPPKRSPSAPTVVSWRPGSIVVFTGSPGVGSESARMRSPGTARSWPPGVPASRESKACSRPLVPTSVPGGKPAARTASFWSPFGTPTSPAMSIADGPSGEVRATDGPFASAAPSAARISARSGARVRRSSCSSGPRPGKTRLGCQATAPSSTGTSTVSDTFPNAFVSAVAGASTTSASPDDVGPFASPTAIDSVVAVVSADVRSSVKRSIGYSAAAAGVSSACIASRSPASQAAR